MARLGTCPSRRADPGAAEADDVMSKMLMSLTDVREVQVLAAQIAGAGGSVH